MGKPREKIAPGQRAGIGVGHIDLELRDHHKDGRGCHRPAVIGKHVFIGRQVHLVRIHRPVHRHRVADGQISQERTAQHLANAQHHPTRPAHEHAQPPAAPVARSFGGHEAQVIGLLAHLRHQGHTHGQRRTKQGQTEPGVCPFLPDVVHHARKCTRITHQHKHKGHDQHHQPQRLGPHLQAADGRDPVRHQRNHHQCANQVTPPGRDTQRQLQRIRHHGRLQRKKDESKGGVNE